MSPVGLTSTRFVYQRLWRGTLHVKADLFLLAIIFGLQSLWTEVSALNVVRLRSKRDFSNVHDLQRAKVDKGKLMMVHPFSADDTWLSSVFARIPDRKVS